MLPRNSADYRSILWALAMPVVLYVQLTNPKMWLIPVSFYFAMAAGTMAHNHNHCPTFSSKRMNSFYANWLSIFYGYPAFAWIPTHNLNHHKHVNREGDATITWRHTNRNLLSVALTYFFVSAYYQNPPIKEYIAKAKAANPRLYRQIITQYVIWGSGLVLTFAAAMVLHPGWAGFKIWTYAFGLPSLFGTWSMMWFNYMQHVHCDPWSKYDHSRNITGRIFNFLVFNNGLHTVHHANASAHWSTAYAEHAKVADKITPALNQPSFWWWIARGYLIPAVFWNLETKQIGRAPFDPPEGSRRQAAQGRARAAAAEAPVTDSVDALEAGNNAQMA